MFTVTSVPAHLADDGGSGPQDSVMDYTALNPIRLANDTALRTFASDENLTGNGTAGNPYVISGYDIKGNLTTPPILLGNLRLHLLISANRIHNVTGQLVRQGFGIANCTNLTIRSNEISNFTEVGIYASDSTVVVRDNDIIRINGPSQYAAIGFYSCDGGRITNNTLTDCVIGARVVLSDGVVVDNNTIDYRSLGIAVKVCMGTTVRGNVLLNGSMEPGSAILLSDSDIALIESNDIDIDRTVDILCENSSNFTIRNNTMGKEGMTDPRNTATSLQYCSSVLYEGNQVNNSKTGIRYDHCKDVTIGSNRFETHGAAIRAQWNVDTMLSNNTFAGIGKALISYDQCTGITINNNTLGNCSFWFRNDLNPRGWFAIRADDRNTMNGTPIHFLIDRHDLSITEPFGQLIAINSSNVSIDGVVSPYEYQGALVRNCDDLRFTDCVLVSRPSSDYWIQSDNVSFVNTTLTSNTLYLMGDGILVENCSMDDANRSIVFMGNNTTFRGNSFGPDVALAIHTNYFHPGSEAADRSRDLRIVNNTFNVSRSWPSNRGVYLYGICTDVTVTGNTFVNHGIEIHPDSMDQALTFNLSGNTLDGRPILFRHSAADMVVTGNGYGQVIIVNCTNFTLHNLTFDNAFLPFQVFHLHHSEVRDTIIRNATDTTLEVSVFYGCDNLTFIRNRFYDNPERIRIERCVDTFIGYNEFTFRGLEVIGCERFDLHNNTLTRCLSVGLLINGSRHGNITNNWIQEGGGRGAVDIVDFYDLNIHHNTFRDCAEYAVTLHHDGGGDPHTYIHHNNFIGNAAQGSPNRQLGTDGSLGTQFIDDGLEGNYWSDYNTTFPNQAHDNRTWSFPYYCTNSVYDRFPLVHPVDMDGPVPWATREHRIDMDEKVVFDASASTVNAGVGNYSWTFTYDDAPVTLFGVRTTFTFGIAGNYSVILNVTDGLGRWARLPISVTVRDSQAPVADAGTDITVDQGTTVTLDATASTDNVGIINYTWSLSYNGTDHSLDGAVVNFTFDIPGVYNVSLRVRDANSNWGVANVTVTVRDTVRPVALAGVDVTVDQGARVTFDGGASFDNVGIISYNWSFTYSGSPVTLAGQVTTFDFDLAGVYTVTLTVTDGDGNQGSDRLDVTVRDTESPVVVTVLAHDVPTDTLLTLDASTSRDNVAAVNWTWTFTYGGGVETLHGPAPSFLFHLPGVYTITLDVSDAAGNHGTATIQVTVRDLEVPVIVTEAEVFVDLGGTARFDASNSTDNIGITGYNWSFRYQGRDVTLTGATPEFTFTGLGVITVLLEVVDGVGNTASTNITVTVRDPEGPVADAGDDLTLDQGDTGTLDGSGSTDADGIASWRWTFQYGGSSVSLEGRVVDFVFDLAGTFDITLLVTDNDGHANIDTLRVTVVDTEPPKADAGPDIEAAEGEAVTLDGAASTDNIGVVSWEWTIRGDAGAVTGQETGMTATITLDAGTYQVILRVVDAEGNEGYDQLTLLVRRAGAPVADAGPDATVEAGEGHTFDASGTTSAHGIDRYSWAFVYDGGPTTLTGGSPSFTFLVPGTYLVTLEVEDLEGNTDGDAVTITVVDTTPPTAHIDVRTREDSERRTLDGSASSDLVGVINWTWEIVFENEITHLYGETVELHRADPGEYRVTLTVRDAAGNEASDVTDITIEEEPGHGLALLWVGVIAVLAVVAVLVARHSLGGREP